MTRFGSAFGEAYVKAAETIRTKTFELGGFTFKVRIPLQKELDEIEARIANIDQDEAQRRYEKMTAPFKDMQNSDALTITEDDVIFDGRSTRDLVKTVLTMEKRIVEYIKLLVPVNGDWEGLTYEEVEAEWPMPVQLEMISKITEAIQPGYKESRKN